MPNNTKTDLPIDTWFSRFENSPYLSFIGILENTTKIANYENCNPVETLQVLFKHPLASSYYLKHLDGSVRQYLSAIVCNKDKHYIEWYVNNYDIKKISKEIIHVLNLLLLFELPLSKELFKNNQQSFVDFVNNYGPIKEEVLWGWLDIVKKLEHIL